MPSLISITVEKMGNTSYTTPFVTEQIDPNYIKFVQPEFNDAFADRAFISYYDNQKKVIVPYVVSETVDDIATLANAAATDPILYYKVVSTFNRNHCAKLCLLNTNDGVVVNQPLVGNDPQKATYDFGERNHMKHVELAYCSYPLTVVGVDAGTTSITLACCVDNFLICGTAITIGGSPYTVLSSFCDGNVGILVLNTIAGIAIAETVELA